MTADPGAETALRDAIDNVDPHPSLARRPARPGETVLPNSTAEHVMGS